MSEFMEELSRFQNSFETIIVILSVAFAVIANAIVIFSYRDNKQRMEDLKKIQNEVRIKLNKETINIKKEYDNVSIPRSMRAIRAMAKADIRNIKHIAKKPKHTLGDSFAFLFWELTRVIALPKDGLLLSTIEKLKNSKTESEIKTNTIIGLLISKKMKADDKTFIYLALSFLLCSISLSLGFMNDYKFLALTPLLLMAILILNHKVLEYRIVHGLYGNTDYEAREILSFIDSYETPEDFDDGSGGTKEFLQEPKQVEAKSEFELQGVVKS